MHEFKLKGYEQIYSKTKHTLIVGISGYGKGNFGEDYVAKTTHKGFVVLDINSQERGEGMYYGVKQDDMNMLHKIKVMSGGTLKPQSYENQIWMFLGTGLKNLNKVPKNIQLCVFSEKWMDNEDLKNFIAINDVQRNYMDTFFEMHADQKIPLRYFFDFLRKATHDHYSKEYLGMKNFGLTNYGTLSTLMKRALWLLRSGLFYEDKEEVPSKFKYINLEKDVSRGGRIISYSTYLIEDDHIRQICIYMLLKKFIQLLASRKIQTPMCVYIREGGDFYNQKDETPYLFGIQRMIEAITRKGRSIGGSEIMVVLDTQYPSDIPDSLLNGFNKIIAFRTTTTESKRFLRKADIPFNMLQKLSAVEIGMGMAIIGGEFRYPLSTAPCLHKKAEPDFDVFEYLGSKFGFENYKESNYLGLIMNPPTEAAEFNVPKKYYAEYEPIKV